MRWKICLVFLAAAFVAGSSYAGGKCEYNTQTCLNHMAGKQARGWPGIESDKSTDPAGYKVTKVLPNGPAEKAGLKAGDILVALNGLSYASQTEEIKKAKETMKPGDTVTYSLLRDGKKQDIKVTLGKMPDDVFVAMVGKHILEHAEVQSASAQR